MYPDLVQPTGLPWRPGSAAGPRRPLAARWTPRPCSPAMKDARRPSRFLPRHRDGWIATVAFVALFSLAMPPVTHTLLDRVEPWVFGIPFFFASLFVVYLALIGVLLWSYRRGL